MGLHPVPEARRLEPSEPERPEPYDVERGDVTSEMGPDSVEMDPCREH
jgi:hypothetical protein